LGRGVSKVDWTTTFDFVVTHTLSLTHTLCHTLSLSLCPTPHTPHTNEPNNKADSQPLNLRPEALSEKGREDALLFAQSTAQSGDSPDPVTALESGDSPDPVTALNEDSPELIDEPRTSTKV